MSLGTMSHLFEAIEDSRGHATLDTHRDLGARFVEVGFRVETESRRLDCFLDPHVEVEDIQQHLELSLFNGLSARSPE